ncbi:ABC transporter permease [Sanguibacter sp. HDW7]|uniref:ABC transporter permease n=1 Tax=Sanguibacter sp. HDW7 TaxID=2714931 RepID=UPI00140D8875|nr:ABC transporter permease [Sanguibacter sp. HDW7]QIK84466.1 FtsX-like permease family protein [Sanguibacter sp. HDW7]
MSPLEIVRSSLRGIGANPLRSCLTLLGVLIGVGSVILLVGVGNGSAQAVQDQIGSLGTTTITVRSSTSSGGRNAVQDQTLTTETVDAIAASVTEGSSPSIATVVPQVTSSATVVVGSTTSSVQIVGTTPDYFEATAWPVALGRGFTQNDLDLSRRVVVLGAQVAEDLFGDDDPVGQSVVVGSTPFVVDGVMAAKDSAGTSSTNDLVVMPLTRVERTFTGYGGLSAITLTATDADTVDAAMAEATYVLDEALGVAAGADAPYTISSQSQLLSTATSATATFTSMLAAVAALSLLVGGIGVTNIMLVTVTERTREIGIRKALGATRAAVLGQFLLEASLLSLLGGALGVLGAWIGSQFTILGTNPVIVPSTVVLALAVSIGIGVVFGGYPALRAARMRPVDALRHD